MAAPWTSSAAAGRPTPAPAPMRPGARTPASTTMMMTPGAGGTAVTTTPSGAATPQHQGLQQLLSAHMCSRVDFTDKQSIMNSLDEVLRVWEENTGARTSAAGATSRPLATGSITAAISAKPVSLIDLERQKFSLQQQVQYYTQECSRLEHQIRCDQARLSALPPSDPAQLAQLVAVLDTAQASLSTALAKYHAHPT